MSDISTTAVSKTLRIICSPQVRMHSVDRARGRKLAGGLVKFP
jgi:hypothetical protein